MEQQIEEQTEGNLGKALTAGIFANLGVAVVKFVAFMNTGSAAMLAESVHSVADSSNQALLFLGMKRGERPANEHRPFGHGRERYFWTFVVAVNIFLLGAVFAIHEGIQKLRHPHEAGDPTWNYIALGLGMVFEAYALSVAWKEFSHWRQDATGSIWQQMREAKDLSLPTILFEDSAALLGLLVAFAGIGLTQLTHNPLWDATASIVIGVILLGVAVFLAYESHSLLVGEWARPKVSKRIREIVIADAAVLNLKDLRTLYQGPGDLLVAMDLVFDSELDTKGLEGAICRIEAAIRAEVPQAKNIYVEASAFGGRTG